MSNEIPFPSILKGMPEAGIAINYNNKFSEALSKLNTAQQQAVETIEGPVLVIAGPGTGKTQIIAARIGHILSTKDAHANAGNILCLTYTDAGTIAMRKRLLEFIGPVAYRVNIFTFHAFCNSVIQGNLDFFGRRSLDAITELEKVNLLREIIDGLSSSHPLKRLRGDIYSDVYRLDNLFRMMKEEDWTAEYIRQRCDDYMNDIPTRDEFIYKKANPAKGIRMGDVKKELIAKQEERMSKLIAAAELFPIYQERMLAMGRYDFSDMILWVIDAFKQDENILRNYQERYQYFLVDEFQDTNGAQNEILSLLTGFWDKPNVFCVGDDDQCIYEFQGARIKNVQDFIDRNSKDLKTIVLTENYRSSQDILSAAQNVIEHNYLRLINNNSSLSKDLTASLPEMQASAVKPLVLEYPNIAQEEAAVVVKIEELQKKGVQLNDIAVIYYRHAQSDNIIQLLEKKSIPYKVRKRIDILDLPLVANILKLFEYINEESKVPFSGEQLLFEILHFKFLGIDPHDIAAIAVEAEKKRMNWRELIANELMLQSMNLRNQKVISDFEKHLTGWIAETSNLTLQILFEKVLNESRLLKFIVQNDDHIFLLQVVHTLFDFLKRENTKNPRMKIHEWLEMIEQMSGHYIPLPLEQAIYKEDGVNFITCHSAKGLEFRYVFLIGCTSDKWESRAGGMYNFSLPDTLTYSREENAIESARRLFYVSMTRAKEHLVISYAANDNDEKELEASQFILESQIPVKKAKLDDEVMFSIQLLSLQQVSKPKIELFDEEYIKESLENFTLSATTLNSYLDCPLKFYFEQILPLPSAKNDAMAFGFCVHAALQLLFDKMKKNNSVFPTKDDLLNEFDVLMDKNCVSFTSKQFENRKDLGKKLLAEYYDKYIDEWNKIVVLEYSIRDIEVDGVPIKGKLDKIEFKGNDVNVVDYKTGKPFYGVKQLRPPVTYEFNGTLPRNRNEMIGIYGGEYWRQIVFYKILMDHQRWKKWNMVSGEIDFLDKNDKGEFEKQKIYVTHNDTHFVRKLISSTYQKIMNHEFSEGCGKEDCQWCGFVRENYQQN